MAKSAADLRTRAALPEPDAFEDNPMTIPYGAKRSLSNSEKPGFFALLTFIKGKFIFK
jgi:hypothetical protein